MTYHEEVERRERYLRELCREWQGILRLRDWDIAVKVARAREMKASGEPLGECEVNVKLKKAIIRIRDPIDIDPDNPFPDDPEETLVHELLHAHFATVVPENDSDAILLEQAIEAVARALVALKRKGV